MTTTARLLLAISVLLGTATPSRADIGVIVLEPISTLRFFTRVGHAGTYFSNICQDGSPIKMRLCRPGERGGLVSSTLIIAAFNAAPNKSRFNFFYRNCSNQAKALFALILPQLDTIGDRTSGITMETPTGWRRRVGGPGARES